MKRTLLLILQLLLFTAIINAQDFPAAEQKWENNHSLMRHKAASGKITKKTATRLRGEYRDVVKAEKRMKAVSTRGTRENYRAYGKPQNYAHTRSGKRNALRFYPD